MTDGDPIPPVDVVARTFITWLEGRGAVWSWRQNSTADWWLDLDGVLDMTQTEANEIAAAAFGIRDAIRAVLLSRGDALVTTIH